jgi:MFS family permease
VLGSVTAGGASLGLLAGGVLTQVLSWHWIFFVNVPIGLAVWLVAARVLERDRGLGLAAGADAPGAVLVTGALMLGVYTIVDAHSAWLAALSVGLLAAFVARQVTAARPLLPLRIFRSRAIAGANAAQLLLVAGMLSMFFLGVLYLQRVLHYDAVQTGLAFLPVSLSIGTLSLGVSARLTQRFGPSAVLLGGLALIAGGLAWLTRVPVDGRYAVDLLPAFLLMGVGAGIAFPSLMTLAMAGAAPEDSGLASGLANTTQQIGGALGLSALATLAGSRTADLAATGHTATAALTGGYQMAFTAGLALVTAALAVTALVLLPACPRAAAREPAPEAA